MQLHSEGWEREEEGRERGAARPAGRMREVAQADPAPSPKRLPRRPTTGPPSLGAPPPAIPPWAPSHGAGPWGRVGSPLPDCPTQFFPLAPVPVGDRRCRSSLDSAPT